MSETKPTYEELEKRCRDAEAMLQSILSGHNESIDSAMGTPVIRAAETEEREAHIRRILVAIRNVNQLIVHEDDRKRLIELAVVNLTETLGYRSAWISILSEDKIAAAMSAGSGFRSGFEELQAKLAEGEFPRCMRAALKANETIVIENPEDDFPECLPVRGAEGTSCMAHRLAVGERVFGILVASVPSQFAQYEEELGLFEGIAADLGFALGKIEDAAALAESRRRYEEIFEGSRDGFVIVDPAGKITGANKAYCEMLGYSLDEIRRLEDLYAITPRCWHEWEREEIWRGRLLKQGYSGVYEKEYIRKDGTVFPVELQAYAVLGANHEVEYVWKIARDVTDRRTGERALRESEEKYRAIIMQSADCLILHDLDANILDVNPWSCNTYGYTRNELLQMKASDLDPEYAERESEGFWERLSPGTPVMFEGRQKKRDGTIFPVEVRLSLIRLRGKNLVLALCRDISERKIAETALRESEEKHRRLFETMAQGVVYQAADGRIIEVNPAAMEILGLSEEEVVGKKSNGPGWEAVREDGSLFPESEHPSVVTLRTGKPACDVTMGVWNRRLNRTVWIIVSAIPLHRPGEEKPYRVYTTFTDITARREAEESLKFQSQVLDQIQDRVTVTDLEGNITYINDAECRMLGVPREEIVGKHVSVYGDDPTTGGTQAEVIRETAEKGGWRGEITNFKSDGSTVILDCRTHLVRNSRGEPVAMCGISTDVTKRREAEQALRESEERFRAIFEHMAAASCLDEVVYAEDGKPIDYRVLDVNPAYERLIGKPKNEIVGGLATEIYGLEEAPFLHVYSEVAKTGRPASFESYFAPINKFLDVTVSRPAPGRFSTVFSDITERKQAETARRESERRLRTLMGNLSGMAYRCLNQPGWPMEFLSQGCKRLTGYAPEDFLDGARLQYEQIIVPEDRKKLSESIQAALCEGGAFESEYRIITADGEERWVWERGRAVGTNDKDETILEGFITDITERKRAEAERERLLSAIEQSGEIIVVADRDANIQYANPAFERVTGYSIEEAVGRNPRFLKSGEQDEEFYRRMWETLCSGRMWQGRLVNKRKDGTLYTEDATISPVLDQEGEILNYVAVKRDMTKELDLEERVRQSQKLEAIGQLAGGVAHDFNNLLLVINGYSEMAYEKLPADHPAKPAIDGVMKAGTRAATLVSQLLAFSRRQIMRPEDLDLTEVIGDLMKMLTRIIGEHIRLDFVPGHHLGAVHADRGMVEQIVMNLCVNARDAMPEGGSLTIETESVYINGDHIESHSVARPGSYVLLSVTDTGCGMDEATRKRVFEPFFTTKEVGRGTGLGLATVYGIVQQHEGMIYVFSEPGKGTTFKVYLPIVERRATEVGTKAGGPPPGGTETILLAEDDEAVLTMVRQLLERVGYTVLAASSGKEALALFERHRDNIDLALLDVVMPEMGGKEVCEQMREVDPDLRVLFASGYSEDAVHTNFVLNQSLRLLQKPYDPAELYRAIRETLDS